MPILGKTKKEVLLEFRTAEILEAARKTFAEKGFHEATVDDIAIAAGVAKGTIYLYYRSKREIYFEALKFGIASLNQAIVKKVEAASGAEQKIRTLIASKITYCDEHRDFFNIYYSELGKIPIHPAAMDEEFKVFYLQQANLIESILKRGMREKVVCNLQAGRTAFAISDIIRGVVTLRILGWSKATIEDDVEFIFDLVWKGIAFR